jgi:hypothetical protein
VVWLAVDKMIILVTGWFDEYKNGTRQSVKAFGTSHGIQFETGKIVVTSSDSPDKIGGKYCHSLKEWVIYESDEEKNCTAQVLN